MQSRAGSGKEIDEPGPHTPLDTLQREGLKGLAELMGQLSTRARLDPEPAHPAGESHELKTRGTRALAVSTHTAISQAL